MIPLITTSKWDDFKATSDYLGNGTYVALGEKQSTRDDPFQFIIWSIIIILGTILSPIVILAIVIFVVLSKKR